MEKILTNYIVKIWSWEDDKKVPKIFPQISPALSSAWIFGECGSKAQTVEKPQVMPYYLLYFLIKSPAIHSSARA